MFTCSKVIRGPTRFGKALNLIFPKLSIRQRFLVPVSTVSARNAWHNYPHLCIKYDEKPWGVLPEKLGGGVPHPSWNPYPVSEKNLWFLPTSLLPTYLFQTSSKNWYPISDLKPWSPKRDRRAWQAYEQSLFFLCPSSKTPDTRKWPRAWLKAREARVSRLCRSTLARVCTPLTKSEKKRGCSRSN